MLSKLMPAKPMPAARDSNRAIKAKAIVMPASTDLYFPSEDSAFEVKRTRHAELRVVETVWDHFAGGPGTSPADISVLDAALKELLAS